ncbi:hypothetical protein [Tunicatimonas pelagia]|uniref:hypothetical protein n=1 Tax=Tunicatimonas pelagia TaxID=931531 RepID=UPI002666DAAE|nr:hypothetical protein [Tunicatimonas pelagia]WKN44986.1 hypothetical protein P0M28_08420 [Tunicatimonas pelagia]
MLAVAMLSCSKDDEVKYTQADVLGEWNITSATPDIKVTDLEKVNTDSLLQHGNILLEGYTFSFEEESEMTMGVILFSLEGTWRLSGERLYLSWEGDEDETETEYVIQSIDQETAVLLQPMTSEGISFNYVYKLEKQ